METISLLEKVMIDLLKDPHCPIYQYRDSQLLHICQQLNLHDFTNVKDDQFHQKFAKLFIQHLTTHNELNNILESSKVKRQDQNIMNQAIIQKSQIQSKPQEKQSEKWMQVENRARKTGTQKNTLTLRTQVEDDLRKVPQVDSSYSVTPAPKTTNFNFKDNNFSFQQAEAKKQKAQTPKISNKNQVKEKRPALEPIPKKKVDICEKTIKEIQLKQIQFFKEQREREIREKEYSLEMEKNDKRNFFNSLRCGEPPKMEKKKSKAVIESSSSSGEIVIRLSDHELDVKPKTKQAKKIQKANEKEHREENDKKSITQQISSVEQAIKNISKQNVQNSIESNIKHIEEELTKKQVLINNSLVTQEPQKPKIFPEEIIEIPLVPKQQIVVIQPPQQKEPNKPALTKMIDEFISDQQPQNRYFPTVNQYKQEIQSLYSAQQVNNHLLPQMIYQVPPIIPVLPPCPIEPQNYINPLSLPNETFRNGQGIVRIPKNYTPQPQTPKLSNEQINLKSVTEAPKIEKQFKKTEKEVFKQVAVPLNQQRSCGPSCQICRQIEIPARLVEIFDDALICASCLLEKINPFQKIIYKLFQLEYKYQGRHLLKSSVDFTISQEQMLNPSLQLELRCVMLNKQGLSDITFPNSCQLSINGVIFKEIRPLIDKSCLKKRKDSSIFLNLQEFIKTYGIQRKFTFSCIEILPDSKMRQDTPLQTYIFGFYVVQHQTVNQVIETIRKSSKTQYIKPDLCKNEIKIDKTKVSFICQMSLEIIQIPAKGEFCQHQQCFCLKNYLEMMHSAEHRKWTCPFCKKVCWSLIIDRNQLQILDRIRQLEINVDQITLEQDGSIDKDDPLNVIIKDETITKYQDVLVIGHQEIQKKVNSIDEDDDLIQEPPKEGKNEFQAIVID